MKSKLAVDVENMLVSDRLDQSIGAHFRSEHIQSRARALQADFRVNGFCKIPGFLPDAVRPLLDADISQHLERCASKDFIPLDVGWPHPGPDCYGQPLSDALATAVALPSAPSLRRLIGAIMGDGSEASPDQVFLPPLVQVADEAHESAWKWATAPCSVTWVSRAPRRGNGGEFQFIAAGASAEGPDAISRLLASRPIESHYIEENTAYLIRGDQNLHRVSPLKNGDMRVAFSFECALAPATSRAGARQSALST
ncbi:MAG: hypothetical protein Q8Q88_01145 [Phenylobacterium sp.]|uniref:HalD/BesD family halogenase n=1 Tax=Phenylobacterium sp. TaxID=1871053 RepID=UPI00273511E5|nr:hypothetical protein [Phenylobacterium sp.]MDP3745630.1 hypothetical protein [Phenylobacterium sp.]